MSINKQWLLLVSTIGVLFLVACSDENQEQPSSETVSKSPQISLEVFKSRTCQCCQKWVDHVHEHGFDTDVTNHTSMSLVKDKYGVAPNYRSCHTAVSSGGFVFEGHVPAKFIQQFLESVPEGAVGLSEPAMPVGTPGMEVGEQFRPYVILQLNQDGIATTYAEINSYEEQF